MRQRTLQHGAQPPKLGHRIVHLEESQDGLVRATHHEAVARASCGATERGGWRRSSTVLVANIDGRGSTTSLRMHEVHPFFFDILQ